MKAAPPGYRIEDDCITATSRATISVVCDRAIRMQANYMLPLLQAAARGDLALGCIHAADSAFPTRQTERWTRPAVLLVADDPWPHSEARGPTGWACANRLRYWRPQFVIVHGTGPHPDHYRMAVDAAAMVRRVAIIETDSAHIAEWAAFLDCPSTVVIRPPAGCVHPETPRRSAVH